MIQHTTLIAIAKLPLYIANIRLYYAANLGAKYITEIVPKEANNSHKPTTNA